MALSVCMLPTALVRYRNILSLPPSALAVAAGCSVPGEAGLGCAVGGGVDIQRFIQVGCDPPEERQLVMEIRATEVFTNE